MLNSLVFGHLCLENVLAGFIWQRPLQVMCNNMATVVPCWQFVHRTNWLLCHGCTFILSMHDCSVGMCVLSARLSMHLLVICGFWGMLSVCWALL